MYLLLTDVLTCARCGPEFGLVLLSERMEGRRVLEGWLGCANCRERYEVRGGFADLRPRPAPPLEVAVAGGPGEAEEAYRLAAQLGIREGPGFALIVGPRARLAGGVAGLVERLEVVAADGGMRCGGEEAGVSRIAVGPGLPFFSGTIRGVALSGEAGGALLEEGARVLARGGRLVVELTGEDPAARLAACGLATLVREGDVTVAVKGVRDR